MIDSDDLFEPFDSSTRSNMRRRIRNWYKVRARSLPWRETGDPYNIWISEIMLQQTTVTTVISYYEKFIARFPTVESLASASEEEVLRYWEGLGYYSRARNIHRAAQVVVNSLDGEFPQTTDALTDLPGIGRYTAGAIVSFAFNRPAPIVEANTLRLYSRLLAYTDDPRKSRGQKTLWAFAEHLLPKQNAGDFNQSLMDLGSLVCQPKEPNCQACPLKADCRAFRSGLQHEIPMLEKRPEITEVVEVAVAIECNGRYLLRRNPDGQWWAGLWDFVRFPLSDCDTSLPEQPFEASTAIPLEFLTTVEEHISTTAGVQNVTIERFVSEIKHCVTRYRIRLQCFVGATSNAEIASDADRIFQDVQWVSPSEFANIPFSMTGRKLASLVERDSQQLRLM